MWVLLCVHVHEHIVRERRERGNWHEGELSTARISVNQPDGVGVGEGKGISRGENTRSSQSMPWQPYSNMSITP